MLDQYFFLYIQYSYLGWTQEQQYNFEELVFPEKAMDFFEEEDFLRLFSILQFLLDLQNLYYVLPSPNQVFPPPIKDWSDILF